MEWNDATTSEECSVLGPRPPVSVSPAEPLSLSPKLASAGVVFQTPFRSFDKRLADVVLQVANIPYK